jgi:hypothetical protein
MPSISDSDRETLNYWQKLLWVNKSYSFMELIDLTGFSNSHLRRIVGVACERGILCSDVDPDYPKKKLYRLSTVIILSHK